MSLDIVKKDNIKVALCFFGLARSLNYTIESIEKNIFSALKDNGIEYKTFFHTYEMDGMYINKRAKEVITKVDNNQYKLLKPDYFKMDSDKETRSKLNLNSYRSKPDPWGTGYETVDFFLLGQYSKTQSYNMIKNSGIDFDYVIYLRPDMKYLSPLNIRLFTLVTDEIICMPDFSLYKGVNDRFSICNSKNYHVYGNTFGKLLEYSKIRPLHSETFLRDLLNSNDIRWIYIHFNFNRVRANRQTVFEHFKKKNSSKLNPTKSVEVKDGLRNILLNIYYYSNKDV